MPVDDLDFDLPNEEFETLSGLSRFSGEIYFDLFFYFGYSISLEIIFI